MKTFVKTTLLIALLFATSLQAQKKNVNGTSTGVSMVLDMQPILQMDMVAPEQVNFVFDEKGKYYSGITKNAATVIKVTSSVSWDLYAVGRSNGTSPNGNTFWDQVESYGTSVNSVADIPMSLLELRQNNPNSGVHHENATYADYSQDFSEGFRPYAGNSLYVSSNGTPTPPTKYGKYLAGHSGNTSDITNGFMPAGSYSSSYSKSSNFEFVIDYRILPGFPAIFPNAFNEDASIAQNIVSATNANTVLVGGAAGNGNKSYAEPGYYTMTVQYVLLEDQ